MYDITDEDIGKDGLVTFSDIIRFDQDDDEPKLTILDVFGSSYRFTDVDVDGTLVSRVCCDNICGLNIEYIQTFDDGRLFIDFCGNIIVITNEEFELLKDYVEVVNGDDIGFFKKLQNKIKQFQSIDIENMPGIEFETLISKLVSKMGFDVQPTKISGDGGIDLIAYNEQPFLEGKYIIQCKRWSSNIGEPILRDLFGAMTSERANKGILVTNSNFTPSAIEFAKGKPIELINGEKLNSLLYKYELLDDFEIERPYNDLSVANLLSSDYIVDDYLILEKELHLNINNHRARCGIIKILATRIFNNPTSEKSITSKAEMEFIINVCRKHLSYFEKLNTRDKKLVGVVKFSTLLNAQMYIIQGDFIEALNRMYLLLEWDVLKWERFSFYGLHDEYYYCEQIASIAFNIIQIYNILSLDSKSLEIHRKWEDAFDAVMRIQQRALKNSLKDNVENSIKIWSDTVKAFENYLEVSGIIFKEMPVWDDSIYMYDLYDEKKELYYFEMHTFLRNNIMLDEQNCPIGIEGYPIWDELVINNMNDIRKKVRLLY